MKLVNLGIRKSRQIVIKLFEMWHVHELFLDQFYQANFYQKL